MHFFLLRLFTLSRITLVIFINFLINYFAQGSRILSDYRLLLFIATWCAILTCRVCDFVHTQVLVSLEHSTASFHTSCMCLQELYIDTWLFYFLKGKCQRNIVHQILLKELIFVLFVLRYLWGHLSLLIIFYVYQLCLFAFVIYLTRRAASRRIFLLRNLQKGSLCWHFKLFQPFFD